MKIWRKNETTVKKQSQSYRVTLLRQVFVLYFIFVPISSILFSSLPERFNQSFCTFYHTGSRPFFHYIRRYFFFVYLSEACRLTIKSFCACCDVTIQCKWLWNIQLSMDISMDIHIHGNPAIHRLASQYLSELCRPVAVEPSTSDLHSTLYPS